VIKRARGGQKTALEGLPDKAGGVAKGEIVSKGRINAEVKSEKKGGVPKKNGQSGRKPRTCIPMT